MNWHESYDKISPYIVRIDNENGFGTGFLCSYNKDKSFMLIATAAHVVENIDKWRKPIKLIHYKSGKTDFLEYRDRIIFSDENLDSAVIVVSAKDSFFPEEPLSLIMQDKYMKVGVEIGWVGFPQISPNNLCFFSGNVSFFIENEKSYLIDGVAINGVSGGPIFNQGGSIVGIVSAYKPNRSIETLPGLLVARDVFHFHKQIKMFKDFDEAKEKKKEIQSK